MATCQRGPRPLPRPRPRPRPSTVLRLLLRLGLLAFSVSMFAVKTIQSFRELRAQNIGTEVKLVNNLSEDPPAVTVCKPGFRSYDEELLERNPGGLWNGAEDTLRGFSLVESANSSMRSVLSSSHWSHPDLVRLAEAYDVVAYVNFGYNGDNAVGFNHSLRSSNSPSAHWHSVPSPLYGRCQQLVVRREALGTLRSALALLKLVFSGRDYEEGITNWLVFLHTPYSFGSDEEVIPVATGFLTEYQVNPVTIRRMSTDSRPCRQQQHPEDEYYDREECLFQCLERTYLARHGCQSPRIRRTEISGDAPDCDYDFYRRRYPDLPESSSIHDVKEVSRVVNDPAFQRDRCGCPEPCLVKAVATGINLRQPLAAARNSTSILVLKFSRSVETFRDHLSHTPMDFLSDCGAFLGLFLGVSVYGLYGVAAGAAGWVAGAAAAARCGASGGGGGNGDGNSNGGGNNGNGNKDSANGNGGGSNSNGGGGSKSNGGCGGCGCGCGCGGGCGGRNRRVGLEAAAASSQLSPPSTPYFYLEETGGNGNSSGNSNSNGNSNGGNKYLEEHPIPSQLTC